MNAFVGLVILVLILMSFNGMQLFLYFKKVEKLNALVDQIEEIEKRLGGKE